MPVFMLSQLRAKPPRNCQEGIPLLAITSKSYLEQYGIQPAELQSPSDDSRTLITVSEVYM